MVIHYAEDCALEAPFPLNCARYSDIGVGALRLYVGNLNFDTDEDALRNAFSAFGTVDEVAIITDRETGRPRGFGFVTMGNDDEARAAIEKLGFFLSTVLSFCFTFDPSAPKPRTGGSSPKEEGTL